ncbi:MAG: YckD family protein, partial [Desulfitobacterium hafniense]|nr:YckD family protein [Desulfitobacterium hafniense]
KRRLLVILASVFMLALIAVPTYAAITDQQKAEIDALNKQMAETQKQIIDKYAEAGEISKAQAEAAKANINAAEQYRQQYGQQQGPAAPAPGYGYGYGCCAGWGGAGYYGGMW